MKQLELAKRFGVNQSAISDIINGVTYSKSNNKEVYSV
jgi:predicted XRE-type DNA-binding protein